MNHEIYRNVIDFIFDKSHSINRKIGVFISILGFLVLIDLAFNITYFISQSQKIHQLKEIQFLKKVYRDDTAKLQDILDMEDILIHKGPYFNSLFNRYPNIDKSNRANFSMFWMVISSSYSLCFVSLILLILPFFPIKSEDKAWLIGWFTMLVLMSSSIIATTWIAYQIPMILDNPIWNYILNFIIHTFIVIIIYNIYRSKSNDESKNSFEKN